MTSASAPHVGPASAEASAPTGPTLPESALRPGDDWVGWLDDLTDVPMRVVDVRETSITVVTASGAIPAGEVLHLDVRRGMRLALAFTVTGRLTAGDGMALEVLELELATAVDLSARQHERHDEGGRAVRIAASLHDIRPPATARLLDRSTSGVRFGAADTLRPGDRVVLRDGDDQYEVVVVRRVPCSFGRAEYGCKLIARDVSVGAAG